jgi:hypothetical protein
MQRPHEWKADMLTLRDLDIMRQRQTRIPKRKPALEHRIMPGYVQKSAEVIVSRKRAAPRQRSRADGSQTAEGPNVRRAKRSKRLRERRRQPKHVRELPVRGQAGSRKYTTGGVEPPHATNEIKRREGSFFFLVCWKK